MRGEPHTDARLEEVAEAVRRALPEGVVSAYLFGSLAVGSEHRESDVDIGVLLLRDRFPSRRERFELGRRIAAALIAGLRTSSIDLVVLNDAPPGLARRVVWEGVRVACADAAEDHNFRRDVLLRAADLEPFLRRARAVKLNAIAPA